MRPVLPMQPVRPVRPVWREWPERLRVFRSCPLITPQDACSSLQMLAIARAMAALCASIRRLLARCSGTLEKLSASESSERPGRPGKRGRA